jgi:hypothetical protein
MGPLVGIASVYVIHMAVEHQRGTSLSLYVANDIAGFIPPDPVIAQRLHLSLHQRRHIALLARHAGGLDKPLGKGEQFQAMGLHQASQFSVIHSHPPSNKEAAVQSIHPLSSA